MLRNENSKIQLRDKIAMIIKREKYLYDFKFYF